jgi:hypothetical protein
MHKIVAIILLTLCLVNSSFATTTDSARVAGDLKVGGIHFQDNSTLSSADGLLKTKGAWALDKLYSVGDIVQIQGAMYICTTTNTNTAPPNTSFWSLLATQAMAASDLTTSLIGTWSASYYGPYSKNGEVTFSQDGTFSYTDSSGSPTNNSSGTWSIIRDNLLVMNVGISNTEYYYPLKTSDTRLDFSGGYYNVFILEKGIAFPPAAPATLSISSPSVAINGDGTCSVSVTISYIPAAGKSAQGVTVNISMNDIMGNSVSDNHAFTSSNGSFIYGFMVAQSASTNMINLKASVGDLIATQMIGVPALSATPF